MTLFLGVFLYLYIFLWWEYFWFKDFFFFLAIREHSQSFSLQIFLLSYLLFKNPFIIPLLSAKISVRDAISPDPNFSMFTLKCFRTTATQNEFTFWWFSCMSSLNFFLFILEFSPLPISLSSPQSLSIFNCFHHWPNSDSGLHWEHWNSAP
jgi:hypothetical protein